jgi:probable addiction module antidote protein
VADTDPADHLSTPKEFAAHVTAAMAASDAAAVAKALAECARAKGMSQVARDAGLSRESLYKWLDGDRNPDFEPVLRVVRALGLKLRVERIGG